MNWREARSGNQVTGRKFKSRMRFDKNCCTLIFDHLKLKIFSGGSPPDPPLPSLAFGPPLSVNPVSTPDPAVLLAPRPESNAFRANDSDHDDHGPTGIPVSVRVLQANIMNSRARGFVTSSRAAIHSFREF